MLRNFGAALAAIAALTSCGGAPPPLIAVHRLVNAPYRDPAGSRPEHLITRVRTAFLQAPPSTAGIPTATIDDDTRTVLAAHPRVMLHWPRLQLSEGGNVELALSLGDGFAGATRATAVPHVFDAGSWHGLPPLHLEIRPDGPTLARFHAAESDLPRPVRVALEVHRIPEVGRTSHRTAELEIPSESFLDFGLGILEPARDQGAVRFQVSVCRADACTPVFDESVDPGGSEAGWRDRRVSLASHSGRRSIRFETEYAGGVDRGFSLPVWANPTILAPDTRGDLGPNVLLISLDTLRADHLSLYGYERETSPFLRDTLGPRSSVFDAYVSTATTTDPSHMTMFTSLSPSVHGVADKLTPLQVPVITLAEVLRARGYATAAFTENGPLAHGRGFELGFEAYTENQSPIFLLPPGQVKRTFAQARNWLENHDSQRFFLFLHTFQVHSPYEPPPGYRQLFDGDDSSAPTGGRSTRSAQELVSDYDREIRFVDDELRSLFEWLDRRDLTANTVLVITSDHGEQFQEHGIQGHKAPPFEELTGIPLLVHGPGIPAGRRIAQPISQLDLMPSLLELIGAPVPEQARGISFAGLLAEAEPEPGARTRPLFTSGWVLPNEFQVPSLAVRVNERKLIRTRTSDGVDHYSYFDLSNDPGEMRNRFSGHRAEAADLMALLREHERDAKASRDALRAGNLPGEPTPPAFDPQRDEQLRALGYIE